jgi:tRNA uridine 5-carbamoylmethylation protein Kti12
MNKSLYIVRGLCGSGKSFIANLLYKALDDGINTPVILNADELRIIDDEYRFIPEREVEVWELFDDAFDMALDYNDQIIIDNMNLREVNYIRYKMAAKEKGFDIHEIIIGDFNIEDCFKRNQHNVPKDRIELFKKNFQFPV